MSLNIWTADPNQAVFDAADPNRHGKVIKADAEVSQVRFDDGAVAMSSTITCAPSRPPRWNWLSQFHLANRPRIPQSASQRRHECKYEGHPYWPVALQPLDDNCFIHGGSRRRDRAAPRTDGLTFFYENRRFCLVVDKAGNAVQRTEAAKRTSLQRENAPFFLV
jgi:hypothetical protein